MKYIVVKNGKPLCYGNDGSKIFSSHPDSFPVVVNEEEAARLCSFYGGAVQFSERLTNLVEGAQTS